MRRIFNILNTGDPEGEDAMDFIDMEKDYTKKKKKKVTNLKVEPIIKIPGDYTEPPHPNLLELPFSMLFISPKGGGKTTTIHNLLVWYKNYFDKIFIFSPTIDIDLKWNKLTDKLHIPPEHCISKITDRKVSGLMNSIKSYNGRQTKNKDKLKVLFVMDDCAESMRTYGKKSHYLNRLAFNHRHYNISHIIVSQSFKKLEPGIRSNATGIVLYNTDNIAERVKIIEELAGNIGKRNFEKLWIECVTKPYGFMYINYKHRLVYEGFDKVIGDLNQKPEYLFDKNSESNKSKSNLKKEKKVVKKEDANALLSKGKSDKIENTEE